MMIRSTAQTIPAIRPLVRLASTTPQPPPPSNSSNHNKPPPKFINVKPSAKLLNAKLKEQQDIKEQRNKLASASLKDIFAIFSPNAEDPDDFDLTNFDTTPYYQNPSLFHELPFFKQQHIINELNDKLKRKWTGVPKDMKRFAVWLSYGSYGPREGFPNF
ncbi:unnamed protein product [Ambrosiozyma monospora]|uniref:Unnamed protein product n=1 Tax=Ambrosiozyma monospora TaxID=43982 RepID=A0ACB5TUA5_AMBMO|nr:unnamed protein product [Ambrosiozyma monospora]